MLLGCHCCLQRAVAATAVALKKADIRSPLPPPSIALPKLCLRMLVGGEFASVGAVSGTSLSGSGGSGQIQPSCMAAWMLPVEGGVDAGIGDGTPSPGSPCWPATRSAFARAGSGVGELDRHLVKKSAVGTDEESAKARWRLASSWQEALALYCNILREAWLFTWFDGRRVPWREALCATLGASSRRPAWSVSQRCHMVVCLLISSYPPPAGTRCIIGARLQCLFGVPRYGGLGV